MSNTNNVISSSIETDFLKFSSLSHNALNSLYLKTCGELAAANLELSDAMQEVERDWVSSYKYSQETSISAREKEARAATIESSTEVMKIRGEIFALKEQKNILEYLLDI